MGDSNASPQPRVQVSAPDSLPEMSHPSSIWSGTLEHRVRESRQVSLASPRSSFRTSGPRIDVHRFVPTGLCGTLAGGRQP